MMQDGWMTDSDMANCLSLTPLFSPTFPYYCDLPSKNLSVSEFVIICLLFAILERAVHVRENVILLVVVFFIFSCNSLFFNFKIFLEDLRSAEGK